MDHGWTAWLIGNGESGPSLRYLSCEDGHVAWTGDPAKALRFDSAFDAVVVAEKNADRECQLVEHTFVHSNEAHAS